MTHSTKDNISMQHVEKLVSESRWDDAVDALGMLQQKYAFDPDIYSLYAAIYMGIGKPDDAYDLLKDAANRFPENVDIHFNLLVSAINTGHMKEAVNQVRKLHTLPLNEDILDELAPLEAEVQTFIIPSLSILCKQGMDSFLPFVEDILSADFNISRHTITRIDQIPAILSSSDYCWFEWCDDLIIAASAMKEAANTTILCRLHSYEAFTDMPGKVNWDAVDKLIVVAEHIKRFLLEQVSALSNTKIDVVPNGVDISAFSFKKHAPGHNIAYVGYINYKKGPMLLLHTFKAMHDMDSRYTLHIAGKFQDHRDALYFNQMIKEWHLESSIHFDGWRDDLDKWLDDKDYILCTSILESQNMSVMQAMAKGIRPLIHHFVGAEDIYPAKTIWNGIDDCLSMLKDKDYDTHAYRNFISSRFANDVVGKKLSQAVLSTSLNRAIDENLDNILVTVGIINCNGESYLAECIESYLAQTHKNLEILIIDDASTDNSPDIIEQYVKTHPHVSSYTHTRNSGGPSLAIQELIQNAKGEYFQWIASDDTASPELIRNLLSKAMSNDLDYVYCNLEVINEKSKRTGLWKYGEPDKFEIIQKIFHTGQAIIPMNGLYRKGFFIDNAITWIIYHGNDFSCDTLNTIHFLNHGLLYGHLDANLMQYRVHGDNASYNLEKRIRNSLHIFQFMIETCSMEDLFPHAHRGTDSPSEVMSELLLAEFFLEHHRLLVEMGGIPEYLKQGVTKKDLAVYASAFLDEAGRYLMLAQSMKAPTSRLDLLKARHVKQSECC